MKEEEFLDVMMEWTENKVEREEFCKIYSDLFEENKEVSSLLPKLKENHLLVLLSNTNYIHQKYGWEKYDFLKYFDKLVLSHEVGAVKPEEKIYRAVMEFSGYKPEEHLFIDDITEYVEAAKSLGWNAVRFTNYNQLVDDLTSLGIKF
jgi:putative hydrolase of the HAD superfamily